MVISIIKQKFFNNLILLVLLFVLQASVFATIETQDELVAKLERIQNKTNRLDSILAFYADRNSPTDAQTLKILQNGVELADNLGDKHRKARLLLKLGQKWQFVGGFFYASDAYHKSLDLFRETKDKKHQAILLRRLGDNYRSIMRYDESIKNLNESLEIANNLKDSVELTQTYNRIAATYFEKYIQIALHGSNDSIVNRQLSKDPHSKHYVYQVFFDSTSYSAHTAISLAKRMKLTENMISSYNIIAALYTSVYAKNDSAVIFYEAGIAAGKSLNLIDELAVLYRNYASFMLNAKKIPEALRMAKTGYIYANASKNKLLLKLGAETLAAVYKVMGDYKTHAEYLQIAHDLNILLFDTGTQSKLIVQQAEYEKKLIDEKLKVEKKNSLYLSIAVIVVLVISVLFIGSLIFRNRFISRTNKELQELNELISQQRDELNQANISKDKFFSIIAHDLKSPLMGLSSYSQILSDDFKNLDSEELHSGLKMLTKSVQNLQQLTNNLLNWAELQLDKVRINPVVFDMVTIADAVLKTFEINAKNKQISLRNEFTGQCMVFADPDTIQRVLHNLVSNAIKFTPRGGEVVIAKESGINTIVVHVKDSGVGIPDSLKKSLFILEKSGSTNGTEGEKGTGLGLMICKEMIEQNKGKIWIDSTPGKGSVFSFTLPLPVK